MTKEVSSRLSPRGAERFRRVLGQRSIASAAVAELSQQLRDLRDQRNEVARHVKYATDPRFGGASRLSDDDLALRSEKQHIDELDARIARISVLLDEQSAISGHAGSLVRRVEEFLHAAHPDCSITDRSSALPAIKRGEAIVDAIESRRRRVRELIAERASVESAPIPAALAKKLAREQVDKLAERGRINVGPLLAAGDPFKFAATIGLVKIPQIGAGSIDTIDVEATLAWLHRDVLVAAIDAEIDRQSDDAHALDGRQRAARLEQIARDQLAAEREECELIEVAREQGITVTHRSDIDVRALLGVETQLVAEAA